MTTWLLLLTFSFVLYRRGLRYLRYLQQEDYTPLRFIRWFFRHRLMDTHFSALLLASACLGSYYPQIAPLFASLLAVALSLYEENPLRMGKITLKMTARAKRIFYAYLALSLSLLWGLFWLACRGYPLTLWLALITSIQLVPFALITATFLLGFDETRRQKKLSLEAKAKLLRQKPIIIGITGSYGKTSAKNLLGNTLQVALGPTFWPAKGVNTIMGATREIRERFEKGYQYAVMEMGAYYPGSIQKLCDFSPPDCAWITCIGLAHLERFKTEEAILKTKGELADALAPGALLVLNGDNPGCQKLAQIHKDKKCVLYGLDPTAKDLDVWLHDYTFNEKGSEFTLSYHGQSYKSQSIMVGTTALSNIAGAFAMACSLGGEPELVLATLSHIRPIDNRLQVQKTAQNIFYIHDAYNSNPIGFDAALEVLEKLPAKRRLLMTPGMIELSQQSFDLNKKAAQKAARICDIVIIVGHYNKKSLTEGFLESGWTQDRIYCCDTRREAFSQLHKLQQEEDAVLIENDLGDLHEEIPRF